MEKGFNSDIVLNGSRYHVQTEDWGGGNPYVVSQVYRNGAIVKSVKTPYSQILSTGPVQHQEAIKIAMRNQHHEILDQLLSGHFFL